MRLKPLVKLSDEQKERATEECEDNLAKCFYRLNETNPFLGYIISSLDRVISFDLPTAGVMPVNNAYRLYVNPVFFNDLEQSKREDLAVCLHEVYHLLLSHPARKEDRDHKLYNIAADLAINSFLPDMPRYSKEEYLNVMIAQYPDKEAEIREGVAKFKGDTISVGLLPKDYKLPDGQTAEWYYNKILSDKDLQDQLVQDSPDFILTPDGVKNPDGSDLTEEQKKKLIQDIKDGKVGIKMSDSHDWENKDGSNLAAMDNQLRDIIREAKATHPQGIGNLPGELQQAISELLNNTINWKHQLRDFMNLATRFYKTRTKMRRNRRFGVTYPGQRTDADLNLMVIVDTSGSVSDSDLVEFMSEINALLATGKCVVTLVQGDYEISSSKVYTKPFQAKDIKITGRGGTCGSNWIKHANASKTDACIIFTDGEIEQDIPKRKHRTLWVLTSNAYCYDAFKKGISDRVIKVEHKKK